jgi:hypothetical protein
MSIHDAHPEMPFGTRANYSAGERGARQCLASFSEKRYKYGGNRPDRKTAEASIVGRRRQPTAPAGLLCNPDEGEAGGNDPLRDQLRRKRSQGKTSEIIECA